MSIILHLLPKITSDFLLRRGGAPADAPTGGYFAFHTGYDTSYSHANNGLSCAILIRGGSLMGDSIAVGIWLFSIGEDSLTREDGGFILCNSCTKLLRGGAYRNGTSDGLLTFGIFIEDSYAYIDGGLFCCVVEVIKGMGFL